MNPSACISIATYGSKTRNHETAVNPFLHNHCKMKAHMSANPKLIRTKTIGTVKT
jgi:hypothetical protein